MGFGEQRHVRGAAPPVLYVFEAELIAQRRLAGARPAHDEVNGAAYEAAAKYRVESGDARGRALDQPLTILIALLRFNHVLRVTPRRHSFATPASNRGGSSGLATCS